MNTQEIFEKGVTPIKGEYAGKRYRVESINKAGIIVREWDTAKFGPDMKHGEYKIWEPEKTLFDDRTIAPTWGNLKKAMEAAGLGDDTEFLVRDDFLPWDRAFAKAGFSIKTLTDRDGVEKKFIVAC